ncbi:hypothetical protein FACS1894142_7060 [Spirochaetia bacterium]|nr:hypothetical protein FACS1894142_7060 [Spirochaetia bacterium]
MKKLSGRERLTRIFQGKEVDRPSLKLWGFYPEQKLLHPDYAPVCAKAEELTDWWLGGGSGFDIVFGCHRSDCVSVETKSVSELWEEVTTTWNTPRGVLREREMVSTIGGPGYTIEHAIKSPQDIEAILSIPYEPFPMDAKSYFQADAKAADRGIAAFGLDHPSYALQRLMGSELLAIFSIDERELLHRIINVFAARVLDHAKKAIDAGVRGVFAWVGPELFIPPLMAPNDFEDFCFDYDKTLCDLIHNAGGYTWLHCHGKIAKFVDRFIDMGIDVLNPLEPPKNGDVDMMSLVGQFGNRMGWEGNIEIQEIIQASPERLVNLIRSCVAAGRTSGRFILCPSAGFMEYPFPESEYIRNLLIYLEEGNREICSSVS